MYNSVILSAALLSVFSSQVIAAPAPNTNVVTGTAYTATFDEKSASKLNSQPYQVPENITYNGLQWSGATSGIPKPAGTAFTRYLIPESEPAYGIVQPFFVDNPVNFTRTFSAPSLNISALPSSNKKFTLNGFYWGCSRADSDQPPSTYFEYPVKCTMQITAYNGIGGTAQQTYATYKPVVGNCQQLGNGDPNLTGNRCARLAYFDPGTSFSYAPFQRIEFTLQAFDNQRINETTLYFDNVSYVTQKIQK